MPWPTHLTGFVLQFCQILVLLIFTSVKPSYLFLWEKNLVFILHHTVWTVLLVSRDDSGNCCPRSWCFIIEDPVISCQSIKKSPNRPMKASEPINKSLTISLTTNPAGATASRDTSQATESWRASQLSSWARPGVRIG